MDETIKELIKKYANAKNSNNGEFSGNMFKSRKDLYNEIKFYCEHFNIPLSNDLFPDLFLELMEMDAEYENE